MTFLRALVALALGVLPWAGAWADTTLVVFSSRQEPLIQPLLKAFEERNPGVTIALVSGGDAAVIERMRNPREKVDVLLTADAGNAVYAHSEGLVRPFKSPEVVSLVPAKWRSTNQDGGHAWVGLSLRARTIVYAPDRVDATTLSTYEALADTAWRGRLCLRTAKKVYNKSLVGSLILRHGLGPTEDVVKGWVANFATRPFAKDSQVLQAIAAGQCDLGLANTYYLGRMQRDNPDVAVRLFWANQGAGGVHVNVSTGALGFAGENPELGEAFLLFLLRHDTQKLYAELNMEFPVVEGVARHPIVTAWGDFAAEDLHLDQIGDVQTEAVLLMQRAGYE